MIPCVIYTPSFSKARKAVETRNQLERKVAQKQRESKEDHLRQLAQKARDERAGIRTETTGKELDVWS